MQTDIDELLRHYITDGIRANHKRHVGLELEFPLIHGHGKRIDMDVMKEMFHDLSLIGFDKQKFSEHGLPLRAEDKDGNTVTFDTCYGNLEYVTTNAPSMVPLYRRWREALKCVQNCLLQHDHALIGMGRNPYPRASTVEPVDVPLTMTILDFFKSEGEHKSNVRARYLDFYDFISSEQVHFNTDEAHLSDLISALTHLDFANVILFSDSPMSMENKHFLCVRNELYHQSLFYQMGLSGAQELPIRSVDDMVKNYRNVCMFQRHRDGKPEIFEPVPFEEYFSDPKYGALPEDVKDFDMERNVVTTSYGTIEYRILCSQPFGQAFCPSAFNEGLMVNVDETLALTRDFYQAHGMTNADKLVRQASVDGHIKEASDESVDALLGQLLQISEDGLKKRGFGEEAFLAPLKKRDALRQSPAKVFVTDARGFDAAVADRALVGEDLI